MFGIYGYPLGELAKKVSSLSFPFSPYLVGLLFFFFDSLRHTSFPLTKGSIVLNWNMDRQMHVYNVNHHQCFIYTLEIQPVTSKQKIWRLALGNFWHAYKRGGLMSRVTCVLSAMGLKIVTEKKSLWSTWGSFYRSNL